MEEKYVLQAMAVPEMEVVGNSTNRILGIGDVHIVKAAALTEIEEAYKFRELYRYISGSSENILIYFLYNLTMASEVRGAAHYVFDFFIYLRNTRNFLFW